MQQVKSRTGTYEISIKERTDGYVARMSFKIGNERNPRLEGFGVSTELAVLHLLYKVEGKLEDSFQKGLIVTSIDKCVAQKLIKSINDLEVGTEEIMLSVSNIINNINYINSKITDAITMQSNTVSYGNLPSVFPTLSVNIPITNNNDNSKSEVPKVLLESFAKEWFEYELSLCKETPDSRNLSQATIDGYHWTLFKQILPHMKKQKIVYLQQVNVELIKSLIKEQKGYDNKRMAYIVLSLMFQYAVKNDKGVENLMLKVDKPKAPTKKGKKKRTIITRDDEELWLDKLEEENTDMSLIFEIMLLQGFRNEEACSLTWNNIDFDNNTITIEKAYKSFAIYDDDYNIIGREKRLDKLKTDDSYRTVPMNPRLKQALLKHREEQKQRFKNSIKMKKKHRYWHEKEYVCLSKTYTPYLSCSLAKGMRGFCKKYNLKKVVPYSLRASFATINAERKVDKLALKTAMGHARGGNTIDQFYILPTEAYMKEEFNKVYSNQ